MPVPFINRPTEKLAKQILNIFGFEDIDDPRLIIYDPAMLPKIQNDFLEIHDELQPLIHVKISKQIRDKTDFSFYVHILTILVQKYGHTLFYHRASGLSTLMINPSVRIRHIKFNSNISNGTLLFSNDSSCLRM